MKTKSNIAIVRGKFLNAYEMQFFEPLVERYSLTGFSSLRPFHDQFSFPVVHLPSPMDLPEFPLKMPVLNRIFVDAQYVWGLEEKLRGYDLAHTAELYYHYTQQCLTAKRRGYVKKVIATVLENIPFNNEGIWGRSDFKKRARQELDHIIALTERTKAALRIEGTPEEKITVIGHFVDTKRFFPAPRASLADRKKTIQILFCGRLEKYKGVYEILYAVKLLLQDKDLNAYTLVCTFVGNGGEKERMYMCQKKLGIESYIKYKTVSYADMPREYHGADIYVAPSKSSPTWIEQYNTTLLEAQAAGLPIVTTTSGGIPENVGEAAVLVQPDDAMSLALALKDFILHPAMREAYGKKARARAQAVHDISVGANKIALVYDRVLHTP